MRLVKIDRGKGILRGCRPVAEALERRCLLNGTWTGAVAAGASLTQASAPPAADAGAENIKLNAVRFVGADNDILNGFVTGQTIYLRAEWSTIAFDVAHKYVVRFVVDGVTVDTGEFASGAGDGSFNASMSGWVATPGNHTYSVSVDALNAVAETDETDNTLSGPLAIVEPAGQPRLTQGIGTRADHDWIISNYIDVNANSGVATDYHGGSFVYDGHNGTDENAGGFSQMDAGIPIIAAAPGTVTQVADGVFDRETALNGTTGNYVRVDHGNGWATLYYHLSTNTIAVKIGDTVARGQVLGLMGSSGNSDALHLHFALLRDGSPVETGYHPDLYFVQPLPYSGDVPTTFNRSGISSYYSLADDGEGIPEMDTFVAGSATKVTYYVHVLNMKPGSELSAKWFRPDGSSFIAGPTTSTSFFLVYHTLFQLNPADYSPQLGTWQVALLVNGVEQDRRSFTVLPAGSTGVSSAKLTAGDAAGPIVIDGRTTPLDFGTATPGTAPPQRSFTLANLGNTTLTTSGPTLPPGFSLVGAFPASVAPGATASFTLQLDSAAAGAKFGEVRFSTNDPTSTVFSFNVSGTAAGTPPAGSPTVTLPGPAAIVYWAGAAPKVLDPTCDTSGAGTYASATLTVILAGHGTTDDRLSILPGQTPDGAVAAAGPAVTLDGVPVGAFSGGAGYGSPLVINFTPTATQAAVRAVMRSVAYSNTSAPPDTHRRYVKFSLTAGGLASNEALKTVIFDDAMRPVLTSLVVGNGAATAQRSSVSAVTATFDRPVTLAAGAATLVRLNTGGSGANDGSSPTDATAALGTPTTPDDGHTWVFPVGGSPFVQFGSLADGIYTLSLDPAKVLAFGVPMAGNPAPLVAPSFTFHRLFGDINGNKSVNTLDYGVFRNAFGKTAGQAGFDPAFDFDANGTVNTLDYGQFRSRFGKVFTY